ncbi:MAG: CPBP family intramembrane glutamic endopeptidase [Syntrophomonadaceae bacterium]
MLGHPKWGFKEIIFVYLLIVIFGIGFSFSEEIILGWFDQWGISYNLITFFILALLLQIFFTILLVIIFTMGIHKTSLADLGIKGANMRDLIKYGLVGGLLIMIGVSMLGLLITMVQPELEPQVFEEVLRSVETPQEFMALLILAAVLVPFSEELFYRGMIYPVFRKLAGPLWGAILAGLVFGLAHWDFWRTIPLAAGGACLCYFYEKSGSILVPTLAHGVWNGIMSLIVYANLIAAY